MNVKQYGPLLSLLFLYAPWSTAGVLTDQISIIVDAVAGSSSGYTTEKCASMKHLVEASIERYRDPMCGGTGPYRAECDNVKFLMTKTGADVYWADTVNRGVGIYLMRGGDIRDMPDLVYAGCIKKIGESNITTLK